MRQRARAAVLDVADVAERASAGIAQAVERAEAEQAVELLGLHVVAGVVLARHVVEEAVVLTRERVGPPVHVARIACIIGYASAHVADRAAQAAARISDDEAFNLIFAPGFSTNTQITDISGRGVGMDVVKTNISKLNGSVRVISEVNKGTTIEIKVPLTLAILPTLMIQVSGHTFALPLTSVSEIFYLDLSSMRNVDGQNTIVIRDKAVPLFFLKQWFENTPIDEYLKGKAHIVLVQVPASTLVGFVVDELVGQEEVVIKPLDSLLRHTPGMSGATITSDGGIALILDIPSLIRAYARKGGNRF